jgi:hypothetical protein
MAFDRAGAPAASLRATTRQLESARSVGWFPLPDAGGPVERGDDMSELPADKTRDDSPASITATG